MLPQLRPHVGLYEGRHPVHVATELSRRGMPPLAATSSVSSSLRTVVVSRASFLRLVFFIVDSWKGSLRDALIASRTTS